MLFSLTTFAWLLRTSRCNHVVSLRRWTAICTYKAGVAPAPPTLPHGGATGQWEEIAAAHSRPPIARSLQCGAARSREEPSRAEVRGAAAAQRQVQQIPPSSDRAGATAPGSRSKTRAPEAPQRERRGGGATRQKLLSVT